MLIDINKSSHSISLMLQRNDNGPNDITEDLLGPVS